MNELEAKFELSSAMKDKVAKKSTYVSIVVNVFLTVLQVIIGTVSGASSLVADGIHSLSDLISDFIVLIARNYSRKDADEDHPYGHYRYENAASFFIGLLLVAVTIGMISSAIFKLENHESLQKVSSIALWIALLTLISKELLFRYMLREAQKIKSSLLVANAWHARSDAASSLVAGLGILGNLSGHYFLDPVAAIIVALVIGKMGISFTWSSLHDLMDKAADREVIERVKQTIAQTPGILGYHDMRTRKIGDLIIVDVHLEIDGKLTVEEGHKIAVEARKRVMDQHEVLNMMTHVDPV